jgi:predicted RNA-binding protein with PIN domain
VADLLIVDGDNVAHRLSGSDPERRRDDLLTGISGYAEDLGADVVVVFDGHGRDVTLGRVRVRYAESETADSVIERLAHRSSELRAVTVVSSDAVLRHVAQREGVHAMSAREFVDRLAATGSEPPPTAPTRHRFQLGDAIDAASRAALERLRRGRGQGP